MRKLETRNLMLNHLNRLLLQQHTLMCDELRAFCFTHEIKYLSADELLSVVAEMPTEDGRINGTKKSEIVQYLNNYIQRWDALEKARIDLVEDIKVSQRIPARFTVERVLTDTNHIGVVNYDNLDNTTVSIYTWVTPDTIDIVLDKRERRAEELNAELEGTVSQ